MTHDLEDDGGLRRLVLAGITILGIASAITTAELATQRALTEQKEQTASGSAITSHYHPQPQDFYHK